MTTAPLREAARVIVLDDNQRVLLRYDENGGFWATPGGSLERGETYSAAALRELHEELGVDEKNVELDAQLAERSQNHAVGGREVRQIERYFPARPFVGGDVTDPTPYLFAGLRAARRAGSALDAADGPACCLGLQVHVRQARAHG